MGDDGISPLVGTINLSGCTDSAWTLLRGKTQERNSKRDFIRRDDNISLAVGVFSA